MKKTFIFAIIALIIPFATFAHGGSFADADEKTSTPEEVQKEQQNHEIMQDLMKKFMVQGTLSEEDADTMVTMMGEKMGGGMMGSGGNSMTEGGVGHHGTDGGMVGEMTDGGGMEDGMMGGSMGMQMNIVHGLVGVTSIVWLIAGGIFLLRMGRRSKDVVNEVE